MLLKDARLGVVGATGAVGREILALLLEEGVPPGQLTLYASRRSAGRREEEPGLPGHRVEDLEKATFAAQDLVLFATGADVAREHVPRAAASGALVVDSSSAFRLEPSVPLVIPEVNADVLSGATGRVVAGPNCTTILLVLAVAPLHRAVGVERLVVSSYQAASGMGLGGLRDLEREERALVDGREPPHPDVFPRTLAGNVIPQCDAFCVDGSWQHHFTGEELKVIHETRRLLEDATIRIAATTVRVPVHRAHSLSVLVETRRPLSVLEARRLLAAGPGLRVVDEPEAADPHLRYPTPLDAVGQGDTLVGRLRRDPGCPRGLLLWVVGDQLLRGAALNAVRTASLLLAGPEDRAPRW